MTKLKKLKLLIPPVAQVIIIAALIYGASLLLPTLSLNETIKITGLIIFTFIATLIGVAGIITFKQAQTTVNPMAPDSASSLVTHGIYRYTRNPMYLGLVILLMGEILFLAFPFGLVFIGVFIAYMNRFQIAPEEQAITRLFGDDFITYQQHTRRWI